MDVKKLAIQQTILNNFYTQILQSLPSNERLDSLIFHSEIPIKLDTEVQSQILSSSIVFTEPKMQLAQMKSEDFNEMTNSTNYSCPSMTFEIQMGEETLEEVSISPPNFLTYPVGSARKQYLEFLSTCLDFELQTWGFNCRRNGWHLVFKGRPGYWGLNLNLKEIEPVLPFFNIKKGTSTKNQIKGECCDYYLGSFAFNQTEIDLVLETDPEQFNAPALRHKLIEMLKPVLEEYGFIIELKNNDYICISTQFENKSLLIQKLEKDYSRTQFIPIPFELPEGLHQLTTNKNRYHWDDLLINGINIDLNPAWQSDHQKSDTLSELNRAMTGYLASFDEDQRLCIHQMKQGEGLSIDMNENKNNPLGLVSIHKPGLIQSFQTFYELMERGMSLATSFLIIVKKHFVFDEIWERKLGESPDLTSPLQPIYIHHEYLSLQMHMNMVKKLFFNDPQELKNKLVLIFQWFLEIDLNQPIKIDSEKQIETAMQIKQKHEPISELEKRSSFDHQI